MGKCFVCDWVGYTQKHHIIPDCNFGSDEIENIIELCPNHHREAYKNEDVFAEKHKLPKGKQKDIERIRWNAFCIGMMTEDDRIDACAYLMRIGPRTFKSRYCEEVI